MPNPFVHVELQTRDLPKAKEFYARLFDWKLQDLPMQGGSYTMIDVGGGTGGGMVASPDPNAPPSWMAYVGVDDVRALNGFIVHVGLQELPNPTRPQRLPSRTGSPRSHDHEKAPGLSSFSASGNDRESLCSHTRSRALENVSCARYCLLSLLA